ncbi:hypothetical protein BJY59DRAFT_154944 [Rhodotorula toruloides]
MRLDEEFVGERWTLFWISRTALLPFSVGPVLVAPAVREDHRYCQATVRNPLRHVPRPSPSLAPRLSSLCPLAVSQSPRPFADLACRRHLRMLPSRRRRSWMRTSLVRMRCRSFQMTCDNLEDSWTRRTNFSRQSSTKCTRSCERRERQTELASRYRRTVLHSTNASPPSFDPSGAATSSRRRPRAPAASSIGCFQSQA